MSRILKAPVTFFIGLGVLTLSTVQLILESNTGRIPGMAAGLACMAIGWLTGWTRYRRFTVLLGHLVLTAGCLVSAWALYQIPFLDHAPSLVEVLDLPLFWGLFTACGGWCMITHGSCACCIRQHESRTRPGNDLARKEPGRAEAKVR